MDYCFFLQEQKMCEVGLFTKLLTYRGVGIVPRTSMVRMLSSESRLDGHKVYLAKVHDDNIETMLSEALVALDAGRLEPNARVVIKPNLCTFMGPETGATTSVTIVDALVAFFNKTQPNCQIAIVESKSVSGNAPDKFRRLGYEELTEKYQNVKLVNLDEEKAYSLHDCRYFRSIRIPEVFLTSNYFVSVAKLKTSDQERITCILKNQFGCIPGRKEKYHPWLAKVIADINHALTPDLCVVDGMIAMEGRGPTLGRPKKTGLLIVGTNPVATDYVAAQVMGITPKTVPHLRKAVTMGLGQPDKITIIGEDIQRIRKTFDVVPSHIYAFFTLESLLQRIADRVNRLGVLAHVLGGFLYERKRYFPILRELTIPQMIRKIRFLQQEQQP